MIGDKMTNRVRSRKKRKLKIVPIILTLLLIIVIILGVSKLLKSSPVAIVNKTYYLASTTNNVSVYSYDKENDKMTEAKEYVRGTKVKSKDKTITIGDIEYKEITIDENTYYIPEAYLVQDNKKIVQETTKYIRTSVIYQKRK